MMIQANMTFTVLVNSNPAIKYVTTDAALQRLDQLKWCGAEVSLSCLVLAQQIT